MNSPGLVLSRQFSFEFILVEKNGGFVFVGAGDVEFKRSGVVFFNLKENSASLTE